MRGRLIFAFEAELAPLSTTATAAASGYDSDFKEPKRLAPAAGQGAGTSAREESAAVFVPVQVEEGAFEKLQQFFSGNAPGMRLALVAHFAWLEEHGLVDPATGNPMLPVGTRLVAIRDKDGQLATTMRVPLYLTEALPGSYGLGRKRNLCILTFEPRDKGVGR